MRTLEFTTYTPAELVEVKQALEALVTSPGWWVFMRFLDDRQREIGIRSLDDETRPKPYWQGYRDGAKVKDAIEELLRYASDEIDSRETEVEDDMGLLRSVMRVNEEDL